MEHSTLTSGTQAFILAKTLQSIACHFAHWEDSEVSETELDTAFAALTEEAMASGDRRRFSLLLMAFLAKLNNGHTRFLDPELQELPPLGMQLRPVQGRWTVITSALPDVSPGDVILHIEDRSVEAWYEELRRYTVGSAQSRTVQFGERSPIFRELLGIFLPTRYTLRVEAAAGQVRTILVDRTAIEWASPSLQPEGSWLSDSVAYLRIPSFLDPEFEQRALASLRTFREARGLIVDVRGNSGGNTPWQLIRSLMNQPYRMWAESSPAPGGDSALPDHRDDVAEGPKRASWSALNEPAPDAYQGQMAILVDRATWSAAEDFTMPFKATGRAVIVGETTGGSTGQPFFYAFENGIRLGVGMKRVIWPDGAKFEGVGILPDVPVALLREDLYGGRDRALERALTLVTP